ncbi:MAG: DUF4760 domain-containing protein [Terriglobia bacterium]
MSKETLSPEQAQLQLQLYELRREAKLRQAREWLFANFYAETPEEIERVAPMGSEENAYLRMVVSYWEQACALLNHGALHEELFFEINGEFYGIWERLKPILPIMRERYQNPHMFEHLEKAAQRYEAWMNQRAPKALEVMREFMRQRQPQTAEAQR